MLFGSVIVDLSATPPLSKVFVFVLIFGCAVNRFSISWGDLLAKTSLTTKFKCDVFTNT